MKHEICKVADIPQTGSLIAPFFGREVHVWRSGERVRAAANACLHFGGPLDCKDGAFICQWHGARFDMQSGERLGSGADGLAADVPVDPRRGRRAELCLGRIR
ncbi:Rieske 2Fe-2S domain-containing protein [Mesorhizobium sp. WSM4898]|uniref:Rieske (2Fe-2S) protein n=1 Tax=Mesorhizobium sp. WSM4898 TaxID=3038544 RepID=UPI0024153B60|nr:Rieske 2Fe-2S domain-containing protein [Mesorhizobium sp. WSM4898]MDG4906594.1 Rieske 2Fe-2S domain-containing protein [Mesorhizobium sp. WSM4898]